MTTPLEKIENKIYLLRGCKVMLDSDLAELYGVETKRLNEQVKRNIKRFPDDFMFQLTRCEADFFEKEKSANHGVEYLKEIDMVRGNTLRSQIATSRWGGRRRLPYAFTEQGVAMLSSVLKSDKAISMNIAIMRAFVKIRQLVYSYKELADKIEKIEKDHDKKIGRIFEVLNYLVSEKESESNIKEIGF